MMAFRQIIQLRQSYILCKLKQAALDAKPNGRLSIWLIHLGRCGNPTILLLLLILAAVTRRFLNGDCTPAFLGALQKGDGSL